MRYFYLFIFLVSIAACRVDEFSPCDDVDAAQGLLCKEFRFENNSSIGYLAYFYNTENQLSRKDYKSPDGKLKKYDTFFYENNKLVKERSYDGNSNLIVEKEYLYDSQSNLSNVSHFEGGVEVAYKSFEYAETLLKKESNFNHDQLEDYTVYQYYNGETRLYRRSLYSAADQLMNYTNIEYFVNNYERHSHYTGNHLFTGYHLYYYNGNGNLTRASEYDQTGTLISNIEYEYNELDRLDISREYDEEGILRKHNKFIYN